MRKPTQKEHLIELPDTLLKILGKTPDQIPPQEAYFAFVWYVEMLHTYEKKVFSKQKFAGGPEVKQYWQVVRNIRQGNTWVSLAPKAMSYLKKIQPTLGNFKNLRAQLEYMRIANLSDKVSESNFKVYRYVFEEMGRQYNRLYGCMEKDDAIREKPNRYTWWKVMKSSENVAEKIGIIGAEQYISDPFTHRDKIVTYWSQFKEDQKLRIKKYLLDDYLECDEDRALIRSDQFLSRVLLMHVDEQDISVLELYCEECLYPKGHLYQDMRENFSEAINEEVFYLISDLENDQRRGHYIGDETPDKIVQVCMLTNPEFYEELFEGASKEEINFLCNDPVFKVSVLQTNSRISDWFLGLNDPKLDQHISFSDLRSAVEVKKQENVEGALQVRNF